MPNYITVIGPNLMQPICTMLEKLIELPKEEGETMSRRPDERGYSISICLLLAVMTESFIMRARYLNSQNPASSERTPAKFISTKYPGLSLLDELVEIFIIRDVIAHNHLWKIESTGDTNIWMDLLNKEIDPLTEIQMDKKYNQLVDVDSGTTKNLGLHVIPTQINRTDVVKVLKVVIDTLKYIDNKENFALGALNNYVMFHKDFINFTEAVNKSLKLLS